MDFENIANGVAMNIERDCLMDAPAELMLNQVQAIVAQALRDAYEQGRRALSNDLQNSFCGDEPFYHVVDWLEERVPNATESGEKKP